MASRPWYSSVIGGIVNQASSVSSATTASMSLAANAVANRVATSRSRAERGSGARSRTGSRLAMVVLARCSALLTEASLLSSMSAASDARNPSTSLSTSTARCRGGRCWTAVTKASVIASLASYRASGLAPASGSPSSSTSG